MGTNKIRQRRRGIILAGGEGKRFHPVSSFQSKHFLPVYDRPAVYFALCSLMLAGVTEILVITSPRDTEAFKILFGDGSKWGLSILFAEQQSPKGLPEAFLIGEEFIGGGSVCLALGDNVIVEGNSVDQIRAASKFEKSVIFAKEVENPNDYGVATLDSKGVLIGIEEKPRFTKSKFAIPGLYFYDEHVVEFAKLLSPSSRGELEIGDLNSIYLAHGNLELLKLSSEVAWFDTGTPEGLFKASEFVRRKQNQLSKSFWTPEGIALEMGLI